MLRHRVDDVLAQHRPLRQVEGLPVVGVVVRWQVVPVQFVVFAGSDWAGCKVTRRCSTRSVDKLGEHLVCFSRRLRESVALSLCAAFDFSWHRDSLETALALEGHGSEVLDACSQLQGHWAEAAIKRSEAFEPMG